MTTYPKSDGLNALLQEIELYAQLKAEHGGTDVTHVIDESVAMGMDNDCTAATARSIVGAVVGKDGVPAHWYKNFNDTLHSYRIDQARFSIRDILRRFETQARRIYDQTESL